MTERAERILARVSHLAGRTADPAVAAAAIREAVEWVRPWAFPDTRELHGKVAACDELRRIADEVEARPAVSASSQWRVYTATVLADNAYRELDNAKLLQEWALAMTGDPDLVHLREANRRVAIATAAVHAAEDEKLRAQQREAGGVRDSDTPPTRDTPPG